MKFKMKKQLIFILLISFILLVSLIFLASVYADEMRKPTGNEIVPLVRGDNKGFFVDTRTTTLYYVSDGKPATLEWRQPILSYFLLKKTVVGISVSQAPWFDKKYTLIKNAGIDLFPQKLRLSKDEVYKIELRAYEDGAAVFIKVY